jgi:uncharacterized protein DUF5990
MPVADQRVISVKIECFDLPPHDWGGHAEIWLGIQRGKEVVQEVKLPANGVAFAADLRVSADSSSAVPNFLGPFAQGPVHDRFIYLCWGHLESGVWVGFRRAKLPLTGLTWLDLACERLLARVRCTDAKGGPICASLRRDSLSWTSA